MSITSPSHAANPTKTAILVDVDTGIDDALALMYLLKNPDLELKAITCVAGNTTVDHVVTNTQAVLDYAAPARDIPVARGAERPLVNPPRTAHAFHGIDGMGNLCLEKSKRAPYAGNAVDLMKATVESSSVPLTLLALGPLTNVALFIRSWPATAARLERVVFMGGAINGGNATPVAEFNAWHDPEALRILLESEIPTTMYGLDVFQQPLVPAGICDKLEKSGDTGTQLVGRLLKAYAEADGSTTAGLGDAGAACLLADPTAAQCQTLPVSIELTGTARGQTLVDRRGRTGESELHGQLSGARLIDVVTEVAADRLVAAFLDAIDIRRAA